MSIKTRHRCFVEKFYLCQKKIRVKKSNIQFWRRLNWAVYSSQSQLNETIKIA